MKEAIKAAIKKRIMEDEGYRNNVYKCSEGYLTVGVGHKIVEGDFVPDLVVMDWFEKDFEKAKNQAEYIFTEKNVQADPWLKAIIYNMVFQMGGHGVLKFRKMWLAIQAGDWDTAADEMKDSKWYKQTPVRAERLIKCMRTRSLPL